MTEAFSAWVTTAEYADGKAYIYYDFPNDQDPHVYVDEDLTDGLPGENMGMAFEDPSHGSDCTFIRDLDGTFHVIYEDWSPIMASKRSWDSPLAGHAVSPDGLGDFTILPPAVDERTEPTGVIKTFNHPHWVKEAPERFTTGLAEYEVHEPEQEAFGDWASICIGGQYYLFGDYDPEHGAPMSIAWLTSSSLDEQFTFCGNIGKGHPDPDICFAEGQFYLVNQTKNDFVSPGPWVEKVEARVGVDTDKDGGLDVWTDWQEVKEGYDYMEGFAKQVKRIPASMDLSGLPAGFGFGFEVRVEDATENESKPILDRVTLSFSPEAHPTADLPMAARTVDDDRAAWIHEAKFGLFIHWGLYSQLARGEWVMFQEKIPVAEYAKLAESFNPVKFNAEEWVAVAKNAGMKYITITSKHHDGFALFDSDVNDYNIVDGTPFKRDVLQELKEACDQAGIKLGFYYSHAQDWYQPGGQPEKRVYDPVQHGDFQDYLNNISIPQIAELLTKYQPAHLWLDTPFQMTAEHGRAITDVVRSLKPDTLVNSRLMYHGYQVTKGLTDAQLDELKDIGVDFLSYRDRAIPDTSPWDYWETCMTLNHSWGYQENDDNWKTPTDVIRQLVEVVSKGGSFLLNVGPTGEGEIPAESVAILSEVGEWLEVNGEAVYGATPTSLKGVGAVSPQSLERIKKQEEMAVKTGAKKLKKIEPEFVYEWLATGKDGKVYIHIFDWPEGPFMIQGFEGEVDQATFVADPERKPVEFSQDGNGLSVHLPAEPLDDRATVLRLSMKEAASIPSAVVTLPAASEAGGSKPDFAETLTGKPNIVVFLADDMGWGDAACYGHDLIKSPNIDKLAEQGVRFTQCYAANGVCSPSRSAILTGRNPYRNGVWRHLSGNHPAHLRESEITYPTLLRQAGYQTCHVGKWHLNSRPQFNNPKFPQPSDHGYDYWMATHNNAKPSHENPKNFVRNGEPVGEMIGFSAPLVAKEAVHWLDDLRDPEKPFVLSVWVHEPHHPIATAKRYQELYQGHRNSKYMGNITQLDHALGMVMEALDDQGLSDNTVLVFTSDNGPEGKGGPIGGSTGGLRGRKRDNFEGGIRVPGIVRWPGHIEAGTVSDTPVIGSDIFATVLEVAGVPLPTDRTIDGVSLVPAFAGKPVERAVPLFWRTHVSSADSRVALRVGDWKLVGNDTMDQFQLFEIQKDWREENDLASARPEKLAEMKKTMFEVWKGIEAEGPSEWWTGETPRPKKGATLSY